MATDKEDRVSDRPKARTIHKIAYVVFAVLTGLAYCTTRNLVIAQAPSTEPIIISNLTLNLLLGAALVGAAGPWLVGRFVPKAPKWLTWVSIPVVGVAFLLLLKVSGMEMKF